MALKIIPDIVRDQRLLCLRADDRSIDAARLMDEHNISAVLVTDQDGNLTGIVTERDITRKIVADNRDPNTTTVGAVMTCDPDIISSSAPPKSALYLMRTRKYRHLPVVDDGVLKGIVSIRDLRKGIAQRSWRRMVQRRFLAG